MTRASILRGSLLLIVLAGSALCDTGVIIPTGSTSPDDAVLSIESMEFNILIDNGHATVSLREVFRNKQQPVLEGTYSLALPGDAAVSNFAVWEDITRIPGVILERKRATELYNQIRNQMLDPGLLQSGEVSESNAPGQARHSSEFTVKIAPIPGFGFKRIEAEYRQSVPLINLSSSFVLPLKPSDGAKVQAGSLSVSLAIKSSQTITAFQGVSAAFPLRVTRQTPQMLEASFTQQNAVLSSDLEVHYSVANNKAPQVNAFRSGLHGDPGYFEATAILQPAKGEPQTSAHGRDVIVLFDTSLSMQWEKLERSFRALEATLRSLKPSDRFNLLVFNSEAVGYAKSPVQATPEEISKALDFVRNSKMRGGTNLQKAFEAGFAQSQMAANLVLLSDGAPSEGVVSPRAFTAWFDKELENTAAANRPHIDALAIGNDANVRLMRQLAGPSGAFEQINTDEVPDFKLTSFVREIGLPPLQPVTLAISKAAETSFVYRLRHDDYPGNRAAWVGEYGKPGKAEFTVSSGTGNAVTKESSSVELPSAATEHSYLPPAWARARVDALLEKIDREGEDKATIDEIIRLSRKFHFVTPYTSFLAAPRSLLRPRLIRPGDPLLRVRTDSSIVSVVALFPFGTTKPLRYLGGEDIWQTRFLAPDNLADGTHTVRLILRDRQGRVFREEKTFLISSSAPLVRVHVTSSKVHPGDRVPLKVLASATTRTITAELYGAEPVYLQWHEADKANTGILSIPADLPPGRYSIHVTAEDIAHNVSRQEAPLEVLP